MVFVKKVKNIHISILILFYNTCSTYLVFFCWVNTSNESSHPRNSLLVIQFLPNLKATFYPLFYAPFTGLLIYNLIDNSISPFLFHAFSSCHFNAILFHTASDFWSGFGVFLIPLTCHRFNGLRALISGD